MRDRIRKKIKKNVPVLWVAVFVIAALVGVLVIKNLGDRRAAGAQKVKEKIDSLWRLEAKDNIMDSLAYMKPGQPMFEAAQALSTLNSPSVDTVSINLMVQTSQVEGFLYYFYLAAQHRPLDKEIDYYIKKNYETFSPVEKTTACMVMAAAGDKTYLSKGLRIISEEANNIPFEIQREFVMLCGRTRSDEAVPLLRVLKTGNSALVPYINWSLNTIAGTKKVLSADRTIADNKFWRKEKEPVIPTVPGTFKSVHTANPDALITDNVIHFYYRGGDGHDRIAVSTIPLSTFDGKTFPEYPKNPIIDISAKKFEDAAVLDPAALYFNKKVFLYYSGLGSGPNGVGLAVAQDFYNFEKYQGNPVLEGRAPEAVLKDGIIYLFYVLVNERGGYSVYLATSKDGYNFVKYKDKPVFAPDADVKAWDGKTVTTPRIVEKNGVYYMLYCGDNKYLDYPPYFGLAFSYDLINWTRGTQNPVFSRGLKGNWDDGGIWYGQIIDHKGKLYLFYEGWGGGQAHEKEYGPGAHSQIGLAESEFSLEDMI